jgi:hypothetical protein
VAQNTSPIFTLVPAIGSATILPATTANTKSDGTGTIGTDILKAFTADATNGSYVSSVRFSPNASAAATTTTATTLRVFISSVTSGATTNLNTWLFAEVSAAAQTADHSTNATFPIEIPINRILPASYTILVSTHVVPAANTSWQAIVFAGNY